MSKRILFIVEGQNAEVSLFKKLLSIFYSSVEYDFYSYNTNIHVLSQLLYNDYPNFEKDEIDLKLVLMSQESDDEKRSVLRQTYNDIYLVFDFDPQHDHCHFDTVRRMLSYFNDSTTNGKLFINYPMLESFKHFPTLPDDSFKDRKVNSSSLFNYKCIVSHESNYVSYEEYNYLIVVSIIIHHLKKINYLLKGEYELPDLNEYYNIDYLSLYDKQLEFWKENKQLYVVNTSVLLLVDFNPSQFYKIINRKRNQFYI